MTEEILVTEIPSSLKQLARLVVRGFYTIEDALIVDILVRNPCMKEDDICELLKLERKQLRARISVLKNDKFIQVRLRMETGPDGKAQKVNYYFINYKSFVNVVKYKLDIMRKRMETEERDATSRASFKCPNCLKTFTDLEADQLYDFVTSEFRCTYCREVVEEDQSAMPKKDSRLLLAKFNEQLEPLFILLRAVEGIKLAPEILEPEPVDISTIRGLDAKKSNNPLEQWSGEATRNAGFAVEETRVDVTIGGDNSINTALNNRKEAPIWMMESTVMSNTDSQVDIKAAESIIEAAENANSGKAADDIMSVLLAHEKKTSTSAANNLKSLHGDSDSSEDEMTEVKDDVGEVETMDSEEEEDSNVPSVIVGSKTYNITDINDEIIAEMTQSEKEIYVQVFQEYYSHMSY
ncbi:general transcription factor IIE subunit 1 [Agrilus planipennis]|uniref:General transcription factor IIE subunit 1 n=1 Tax=Agrilus planipennis TaxID=224129 RepID=A0A1W4X097_AGRPL|nr:general transcription factor IIE subunit 1 [Agrilus planipennis]